MESSTTENNSLSSSETLHSNSSASSATQSSLTATEFMDIWKRYDLDGNGFIEKEELEPFLKDFASKKNTIIPSGILHDLRKSLTTSDKSHDGKIDINELAQLLPIEQNFLLLFRHTNALESSVDFMRVWNAIDVHHTGCIEADELKTFLRQLITHGHSLEGAPLTDAKLDEYAKVILQLYDTNHDGKLQLSEMARLLPIKHNILTESQHDKAGFSLKKQELEHIFKQYDKNGDKCLSNEEIDGLCNDMLAYIQPGEHTKEDLDLCRQSVMACCDPSHNGQIDMKDFGLMLKAMATFQECKTELHRKDLKTTRKNSQEHGGKHKKKSLSNDDVVNVVHWMSFAKPFRQITG